MGVGASRELGMGWLGKGSRVPANGRLTRSPAGWPRSFRPLRGRCQGSVLQPDNQLLAEQLYGRKFMERLRRERKEANAAARSPALPAEMPPRACPGGPI